MTYVSEGLHSAETSGTSACEEILNHLVDAQGVPEQEIPKTHLPTPVSQSTKPSTNRPSDVPLIHLHVYIKVNSEVNSAESRISQPLTTKKQLEPERSTKSVDTIFQLFQWTCHLSEL